MLILFIIILTITCCPSPSSGDEQALSKEIVDAANAFALDLFQTALSEEKNVVMSPLSVNILLGLVWMGAEDATAEEIQNAMHIPGDKQRVAAGYKAVMSTLMQKSKDLELRIANKLFLQKKLCLQKSFRKMAAEYFQADAQEIDFDPKNASTLATIDKWVAEQTNNKIKQLFPKGLLKGDTKAVFANVIYLKALWATRFNPQSTTKDQFYFSDNKSQDVYMMHKKDGIFQHGVIEEINSSVLVLPYLDLHPPMEMLIILPHSRDGLPLAEAGLRNVDLNNIPLKRKIVNTAIPKFRINDSPRIKDGLIMLGVKMMFTEQANLQGIANNTYISEAIQKTFINVDEMGTEAAAATGFAASRRGPMPADTFFIADHPFLFIIRKNKIILFIGRVIKPVIA